MTRMYKPGYLEKAVYSVLKEMTGEQLAFANQQIHELTPPYTLVEVSTRQRQGSDALVRIRESDGAYIYHGNRFGALTITVVGDECGERADNLINALQRDSAIAASRKYGPVIYGAQQVTEAGIITEGTQIEQAVVIDAQYRTKVIHFESGGWIETVALGWAFGMDPAGSDDVRGALVVSKPGTTPPAGRVLIVVIDPPEGELKAGTRTDRLPFAHVQPFDNIQTFSTDTSDPTIAEIVRPPAPEKDYLVFHKAGSVAYTVSVTDKTGAVTSDTVILQITD